MSSKVDFFSQDIPYQLMSNEDHPPPQSKHVPVDFSLSEEQINSLDTQLAAARINEMAIIQKFTNLQSNALNDYLKHVASSKPELMDRCIKLVPLDKLKATLENWNEGSFNDMLHHLADCVQIVKYEAPPVAYKEPTPGTLDSFKVAASFLAGYEPAHAFEAMQMLQVYTMLLAIPFLGSSILFTIFAGYDTYPFDDQLKMLGLLVAIMLLGLMACLCVSRKPSIPAEVKPLRNYTREASTGYIEPLLCRDDVIAKVLRCWQSTHGSIRLHPLLVGSAGVGKTVILLEIARRIARGDVPQMMKEMQILGGPAALLLPNAQMMDSEDKMERFLKRIAPFKERTILALDEIHVLMNEQYGPRYSEVLKSMLDTGMRGLPFFVGATTDDEYRKYIAPDPARARRFFVINVPPLDDRQTKLTLREMVRHQYPTFAITDEHLNYLIEKTNDAQARFADVPKQRQPEVSKRILSLSIATIVRDQFQMVSSSELQDARVEQEDLRSQCVASFEDSTSRVKIFEKMAQVKETILRLEVEEEEKRTKIQKFQAVVEKVSKVKEECIALAAKIKVRPQERLIAELIIKLNYYLPFLLDSKKEIAQESQIPQFDKPLIDRLTDEFFQTLQKANKKDESKAPV